MNLSKIKKYLIVILVVLEVCLIHLSYKSYTNKPVKLPEVKLLDNDKKSKNKTFGIMLNDGSGDYTESTDNKFPTVGYIYNEEKSGCIDSNGKQIFGGGGISYNQITHQVSLRLKQKAYCYLYFDKKDIPVIDKFYINDETSNKTTKEPEVTLRIKWSDPYIIDYCISETNNVDSCTWISSNGVTEISSNYTFTEQGTKIFYAYIKDIAQGISEVKSDSITYSLPLSDKLINNPISGVVEPTGVAEDELATRFYGTNPPNYICFGTTSKSTCTGDIDKYMYRIIGVDKSGRYKVIKKTSIDSLVWHSSTATDIQWPQSDLYKNLNGSYFLSNSTYMPSDWSDKIDTVDWKYGDIYDASDAHNATNVSASQMLQKEQGWTTTTSAKIGLMYLGDYYYGLNKVGLNCSGASSGTYPQCATSWMNFIQNDTGSSMEWSMVRYGKFSGSNYIAWRISSNGFVGWSGLSTSAFIRPVFYIVASAQISGTGTIDDPYLITN